MGWTTMLEMVSLNCRPRAAALGEIASSVTHRSLKRVMSRVALLGARPSA